MRSHVQEGSRGAFVAVALLSLFALFAFAVKGGKKSGRTVFLGRSAGITASHPAHVSSYKADCEVCHEGAIGSGDSSDYLVPGPKSCSGCHPGSACGSGKIVESCGKCHAGKPVPYATLKIKHRKQVEVKFPHARHVKGKGGGERCAGCHPLPSARKAGKRSNPGMPGMKLCLGCHNHSKEYESFQCDICHFKNKEGKLKTKLPGGVLLEPPSWMSGIYHGNLWYEDHEVAAANHSSLCAACHTNDDCLACHAGTGKARPEKIHPDDWIQIHGLSSMSGDLRCSSCHNLQHQCLPCHRRSGVAWDSPAGLGVPSGSLFHPQKWYSLSGEGNLHSLEARHSISSCVSCHTENDCMMCHASASGTFNFDFNPHPPSPAWLKNCKSLSAKNPGVCLKCHIKVPPGCK